MPAELGKADRAVIESAGVQIYPEATFVNGNQDVGFRFATKKSPGDTRDWYREHLSKWSLYEEHGGWILYDGKPGLGLGALMSKKQVAVQTNKMLHDRFGADEAKTTEIVIMIPRN